MTEVPAIRLRDAGKRFGPVTALDGVSFDVAAGEVRCLLGENGAGKSTLIALLGGLQQPDAGTIEIDGRAVTLSSPSASLSHGISVVQQHSTLIPAMTVRENLQLAGGDFWLSETAAEDHLAHYAEMFGAALDPDGLVGQLSLGTQQQLEIVRALGAHSPPRILVLDEPTSMLDDRGTEAMMRGIEQIARRGTAVVFVTHRLPEALTVADAITVLRRGSVAARFEAGQLLRMGEARSREAVLEAMFGKVPVSPSSRPTVGPAAEPVLRVEALSTARSSTVHAYAEQDGGTPINDVSFEIRAGETLGIAGIDGHGQRHLAEVIAGQRPAQAGRILFENEDVTGASVRERQRRGLRYVTDDRLHEGIIGAMSVALNLMLKRIGQPPLWRRFGRMNRRAVREEASRLIEAFDVRTPSPEARAGTLSGGNIQKLLLARELSHAPRAVVFHKPSYGLDLNTVRRVHEAMREFTAGGGAALLISTELDELVQLADRVLVISDGRVVGEALNDGDHIRERLGELIAGSAA